MPQDSRYINIPYSILRNRRLSDKEKMLYGYIAGFFDGECVASNEYIGTIIGGSKRTIQRCLKSLIEKGFITKRLVFDNGVCIGRILRIRQRD